MIRTSCTELISEIVVPVIKLLEIIADENETTLHKIEGGLKRWRNFFRQIYSHIIQVNKDTRNRSLSDVDISIDECSTLEEIKQTLSRKKNNESPWRQTSHVVMESWITNNDHVSLQTAV